VLLSLHFVSKNIVSDRFATLYSLTAV